MSEPKVYLEQGVGGLMLALPFTMDDQEHTLNLSVTLTSFPKGLRDDPVEIARTIREALEGAFKNPLSTQSRRVKTRVSERTLAQSIGNSVAAFISTRT